MPAMVPSSASPRDAPICWEVITAPPATPASRPAPRVAMLFAGIITQPIPKPSTTSDGSAPVQ